jgi:hypothetical protein
MARPTIANIVKGYYVGKDFKHKKWKTSLAEHLIIHTKSVTDPKETALCIECRIRLWCHLNDQYSPSFALNDCSLTKFDIGKTRK